MLAESCCFPCLPCSRGSSWGYSWVWRSNYDYSNILHKLGDNRWQLWWNVTYLLDLLSGTTHPQTWMVSYAKDLLGHIANEVWPRARFMNGTSRRRSWPRCGAGLKASPAPLRLMKGSLSCGLEAFSEFLRVYACDNWWVDFHICSSNMFQHRSSVAGWFQPDNASGTGESPPKNQRSRP